MGPAGLAGRLLLATGVFALVHFRSRGGGQGRSHAGPAGRRTGRLIVTGVALSVDNLAVGFALGTFHVSLPVAVIVIGAVSVRLSLIGLELRQRLGARTGDRGEVLGGLVLIAVGIAVAAGVL